MKKKYLKAFFKFLGLNLFIYLFFAFVEWDIFIIKRIPIMEEGERFFTLFFFLVSNFLIIFKIEATEKKIKILLSE